MGGPNHFSVKFITPYKLLFVTCAYIKSVIHFEAHFQQFIEYHNIKYTTIFLLCCMSVTNFKVYFTKGIKLQNYSSYPTGGLATCFQMYFYKFQPFCWLEPFWWVRKTKRGHHNFNFISGLFSKYRGQCVTLRSYFQIDSIQLVNN